MQSTRSLHAAYMWSTRGPHVVNMQPTCRHSQHMAHAVYTQSTCSLHAVYMQFTCSIRTCNLHAAYMQTTWSLHETYISQPHAGVVYMQSTYSCRRSLHVPQLASGSWHAQIPFIPSAHTQCIHHIPTARLQCEL